MFSLWIVITIVVAVITCLCAVFGAFKKSAGFWLVSGAAVDAGLYLVLVGMAN